MKGLTRSVVGAAVITFAASASLALNCCYVDDPTHMACIANSVSSTNTTYFPGGSVCGHTLDGSNCVLEILGDQTGSGGSNCLTVGKGVTVDMNNAYTFRCSAGSKCGSAIKNTDSAASANKTIIRDGTIAGCWTYGVEQTGGTNTQLLNVTVDFAATGSCPSGGDNGVSINTVTQSLIKNAAIAVVASLVEHSIIRDNDVGVRLKYGGDNGTINNSLLIKNGFNIRREAWGLNGVPMGTVTLKSSAVQDPTDCDCAQYQPYGPVGFFCEPTCGFLLYSGDPTFLDESIH